LALSWAHPSSIYRRQVSRGIWLLGLVTEPCAGVLGLHAIKDKAVVVNGKIEIRPVCATSFRRLTALTSL
jgi:hypothetical protein